MVKCLYCGEEFNKDKEPCEKIKNRYIHLNCFVLYEEDSKYKNEIHRKCKELFGDGYSVTRINKQLKTYIDEGLSYKDIYEAVLYWYDIKNGDVSKSNNGIGIIGYIISESKAYYKRKAEIETNTKDIDFKDYIGETEHFTVKRTPIKKPKRVKFFNLK